MGIIVAEDITIKKHKYKLVQEIPKANLTHRYQPGEVSKRNTSKKTPGIMQNWRESLFSRSVVCDLIYSQRLRFPERILTSKGNASVTFGIPYFINSRLFLFKKFMIS